MSTLVVVSYKDGSKAEAMRQKLLEMQQDLVRFGAQGHAGQGAGLKWTPTNNPLKECLSTASIKNPKAENCTRTGGSG